MKEMILNTYALLDRSGRRVLLMLVILILVGSFLEAISLGSLLPLIKYIVAPGDIHSLPLVGKYFPENWLGSDSRTMIILGGGIFTLFFLKNIFLIAVLSFRAHFISFTQAALATKMLKGYLASPYTFHISRNSAEIIRNLNNNVNMVFSSIIFSYIEILIELTAVIAVFSVLLFTNPLITISAGLFMGAFFGLFYLVLPRLMNKLGGRSNIFNRDLIKSITQCLGGIKEIKVLGREFYFVQTYKEITHSYAQVKFISRVFQSVPRHLIEMVFIAGLLLAIWFFLDKGMEPQNLISILGLFAVAAYRLVPSFNRLLAAINNIHYGRAGVNDVYNDYIAFQKLEAENKPVANTPVEFNRQISIENLSYRYPEAEKEALCGLTFSIDRGQSIGVVGRSGSGKTTFVDVLLGVLFPSDGQFSIDGTPVNENLRGWQDSIGYVPQSIYLLDDTLRTNIAFGVDEGEIDDERLSVAITAARLDRVLKELPDGLDTVLGEHGVRLSGGQRQRVGIARALYNDPDVLVMDEATSALDSETELEISRAIDDFHGRKTIILIAHRLSTVRKCDNIIFLNEGELAGFGSFDELFAKNDEFRAMVDHGKMEDVID
jgi:ATP-binding cassette, subfamily B, bacterial PglK